MALTGYIGSEVSKVARNIEATIKGIKHCFSYVYIIWRQISQLAYSSHILYIYIYIYAHIYILKLFGIIASLSSVEEHMASIVFGLAIRWWVQLPKLLLI
jgi:hypothetical protein